MRPETATPPPQSQSPAVSGAVGAPLLATLDRVLARFEDALSIIASVFIFGLMFLGIAQVLGRQFFDRPVAGYIDFVELSMATFAFLGVAYCQRVGGHVRMDLFVKLAPGRWHWIMEAVGVAIAAALIAVLIWYGWEHFLRAYQLGDSTIDAELPVWPSKLLVPFAFSFLLLRLLVQLAGYLRLIVHPDAVPVGVPRLMTVEEIAAQEIEETEARR